jgi:hypothetical protein
VVAAAGSQNERQMAGLGQNLETEPPGHAIGGDSKGACGEVVGRCVRGGNGGRVPYSVVQVGVAGCRPKVKN